MRAEHVSKNKIFLPVIFPLSVSQSVSYFLRKPTKLASYLTPLLLSLLGCCLLFVVCLVHFNSSRGVLRNKRKKERKHKKAEPGTGMWKLRREEKIKVWSEYQDQGQEQGQGSLSIGVSVSAACFKLMCFSGCVWSWSYF